MTTTEAPITERLDDLREGTPGNVRATVDHLLNSAWEGIWQRRRERDADGILTALGHVDAALELLTACRERLAALEQRDGEEHLEVFVKQQD